jgi:hypothetical protein
MINFFLSRAGSGLLGLLVAAAAFVTVIAAFRRKGPRPAFARGAAVVTAALAVFLAAFTVNNILARTGGLAGTLPVAAPAVLYALAAAAFAVLLFLHPGHRENPALPLTAAIAAGQFALLLINLARNWRNFTGGSLLFFYVQVLLLVLAAGSAALWLLSARRAAAGTRRSRLAGEAADYGRLGIKKGVVEPWEDGTRTNAGERGTYEWWYFDSRLEDGSSLVIVFYTKPMMSPGSGPDPNVTIRLIDPAGKEYAQTYRPANRADFSASKDGCDVRMGVCTFKGNLKDYQIYYDDGAVQAKVTLTSTVPAWRPETGHIFFGDQDEDYFAWLPAVPEGKVSAEITREGKTTRLSGTGYHDHNWGNANMRPLLNHWYWGRAKIGPYTAITSWIWGEKKYGYNEFPIFMLAKEGKIIAEGGEKTAFQAGEEFLEKATGKPVHNLLVYDYTDGAARYRVTYRREASILNFPMIDDVKGFVRFLAKLSGFDGAYHRFTGRAEVERFSGERAAEKYEAPAIWELMYFGHTPKNGKGRTK